MADGYQRLDTLLVQFIEDLVVERQALLVGHQIISVGEDAAPVDGHAEHLEAHLAHKRGVLGMAMIKVACEVVGIAQALFPRTGDLPRRGMGAVGHHICVARTLAAKVPAALELVGCGCATP